jgi:hypothetical protein
VDISTAAPKVGRGIFCPSCYLDCGKWTSTDQQGRFSIKDLDPSLKFRLVLIMPGHRSLQTELVDPVDGPLALSLEALPAEIDQARVVSGVVTHDGVPVVGALVEPHGAKTASRRWWGKVDGVDPTVTDHNGHFAMILPDEFLGIDIEVTGHGFCGEQLELLEPGSEAVPIEVKSGASVTGKVVRDGLPVTGMSLAVVQLERGVSDGIFIAAVGDVTNADGEFEFHHLPPDQRYCIYSVVGEAKQSENPFVLTSKTFLAPGTGKTRNLGSLEVTRPFSVRGQVRRIDGLSLPQHLTLSLGRDPAWDLVGIPVREDGSFEATGLPPETYEIRLGSRDLVVVPEQLKYQLLSESSFGLRLRSSLDSITIPVKGRQ